MLRKILSNKLLNTHIVVWVIYVVYFSSLVKFFYNYSLSYSFIVQNILQRLGEIGLFYASAFWIFPKYLNLKKWIQLTLTFTLVIAFYLYYKYLIEFYIFQFLNATLPNDEPVFTQVISQAVMQGSNFIIFALGYYFAQRVIQQQREIAQKDVQIAEEKAKNAILEKEKSEAELAFLRSQINPHFMFNTLNMIYSKIFQTNKEAGEIVIQFSDMMKYATSTKLQANEVDIRGELDFVKSYIELHILRFNHTVYIDYDEEGYMMSHRIVPMVLITIVENAIKHGYFEDPNFPIIIRASLIDDYFSFMVHNLKNLRPNELDQKGNTGIGIVNIEKRLAAVYKNGGYSLEKEETPEDYIVTFTVNFKETKI
jgi:two-component system, LytTR family, sensor kinase